MPHDTRPTSVTDATRHGAWPTSSDLGKMAIRRRLCGGWPTWAILAHEAGVRRSRGDRLMAIAVKDKLRPRECTRILDACNARRAEFRTFDGFARYAWTVTRTEAE